MSDAHETTLRLERLIASPPELLFKLFTEPAQLVKWWAPDGTEARIDVLDVRPGGRWRIILRGADCWMAASGVYRIVEPPHRLVLTWAWEDTAGTRGHETEVVVTFDAAPGGTRLLLVQQQFENQQACDNHHLGWWASLDRIVAIASR
ncbi:SRPBCC family protein [Bradyrhizobium sp.]|uniref:SRPBCC family protein n=1 Tax=Bradyrhizobium sp. TaxID=376 RepID=UPI003C4D6CF8